MTALGHEQQALDRDLYLARQLATGHHQGFTISYTARDGWRTHQPDEAAVGTGVHLRIPTGPRCRICDATEQQCAYRGSCCETCSHWTRYDAAGNPFNDIRRPRSADIDHGTERGYQSHRYRKQPPCTRCCRAHSDHNQGRGNVSRSLSPVCPSCGRHTPLTIRGLFIRHRIEADNPLAPYCKESGK